MKTTLPFLLIIPLLLCVQTIKSQTTSTFCGMHLLHDERLDTDPAYAQKMAELDQYLMRTILQERSLGSRSEDTALYTIPVVFHILHNNGNENIADSRIYQELVNLNEAYRNIGYFDQGAGIDMNITFCLASVDPDGFPTNGIERIQTADYNITSRTQNAQMRRKYNWDPNRYLNFYTAENINFNGQGIAGTAIFPDDAGQPEDGITILADLIGLANTKYESATMAHELGHYFGLYHTHQGGCENFDCMLQGDRVCDTRPDNNSITFEGCINQNNCSTDADDPRIVNPFKTDSFDMNRNYMDYNSRRCRISFTEGQRERVRAVIRNLRSSLLTSNVCRNPMPYDAGVTQIEAPNYLICDSVFLPEVSLTNFGLAPISTVDILYQVDGGPIQTFSWSGNVPYTQTTTVLLDPLQVTKGLHELRVFTSMPNGQQDGYADNDTTLTYFTYSPLEQVPVQVNFEQGIPDNWTIYNPYGYTWEHREDGCDSALGNAHCLVMDNTLFYGGGYEDGFTSPAIDLTYASSATLSFDYAYGFKTNMGDISDQLSIQVSTDCGKTFQTGGLWIRQGTNLSTKNINNDTASVWKPTDCGDWQNATVNLGLFLGREVVIQFLYTKSRNGFPIYLDNINIDGIISVDLEEDLLPAQTITVFPNPNRGQFFMETLLPQHTDLHLTLTDFTGRVVMRSMASTHQGGRIPITTGEVPKGIYLLKVDTSLGSHTAKVVIL